MYLYGYSNLNNITTYYVHDNDFINEQALANIYLSLDLSDFSLQFAHIYQNNFLSPNVYGIYNGAPYGGPNIQADSNYWGTANTQHVDSAIYDYFDNSNSSVVFYSPILTSSVEVDTTCPSITTNIKSISKTENHFLLYPNPTHDKFVVESSEIIDRVTIYDITGRVVHEQTIINHKSEIINSFSPGVYLIKVMSGERVMTEKLVVE